MTDVRLTALNPEDSQVYPVACNSSGELLVSKGGEEPDKYVEKSGDNMTGDLTLGTDKVVLDAGDGSITADNISLTTDSRQGPDAPLVLNNTNPDGYSISSYSNGTSTFAVSTQGGVYVGGNDSPITILGADGSATFKGDVVVGSRNASWMIVEQSGLAHLVEQATFDAGFSVNPEQYPKLRDIPGELDLIEKVLNEVMEKLRLIPPSGWPVWDGSDET